MINEISNQLNVETLFLHNLSLYKDKLEIYKKALSERKITNFDQTTITRLRKLYYGLYTGLIYEYYYDTNDNTIGNKLELLTHTMEDKKFSIVHGYTDSTRNIKFNIYELTPLNNNSWIEVEEGHKVWVYDLFSMLKIEKEIYYKIEQPTIIRKIPKQVIMEHPARENDDYKTYHNGFDFMLVDIIQQMEQNMQVHPFRNILWSEITRFKKEIDFDKLVLDYSEVKRKSYFK